ncbi:hypothetical protein EBO15_20745 [Actinomadura harenae]|uniref:Uncharacterized protein n=1 Tax=Actinomadura harenae TaxID=2483351 RepID=A0A3M2LY00_9ACTN|nr:hypothetical protein EBO15_20745 [Actinomadura harenae]
MTQIWICSMSEVVRADQVTSLFVSSGPPDNRLDETSRQGVLWAHVVGRDEPVRLDGFAGITPPELLNAFTQTIAEATEAAWPVAYIRLDHTGGRAPATRVKLFTSFSTTDASTDGQR